MSFTITKNENLDEEYYGYETEYSIDFQFQRQRANVTLEIWNNESNKVRLSSNTDGYHWLQFFLSQKPLAEELVEMPYDTSVAECQSLFASINVGYEQEGKDTAWLSLDREMDEDLAKEIAKLIEPRFANRERFFE
jgi:hypothetical protein